MKPNTNDLVNRSGVVIALIVIVNLIIYGQTVSFDLISLDDPHFITNNPNVTGGLNWINFLWSFHTFDMGIWHPLTWLTYQLETTLFGENHVAGRHAVNLFIHIGNSILVFLLFRSLLRRGGVALILALLFSVHPQHIQVVAWVSERKELLAVFFGLLSIWLYVLWKFGQRSNRWYWFSFFSYLLAVLSKPSIVPLPIVLVALDFIHFYRSKTELSPIAKSLIGKLPFIVVSFVISYISVQANTGYALEYYNLDKAGVEYLRPTTYSLIPVTFKYYLVSAFTVWEYPFYIDAPEISIQLMLSCVFVILLFCCILWLFRSRYPMVIFAAFWFVLFWLPVSGIVSFGKYFVADRYSYIPHIGLFLMIVYLVSFIIESLPLKRYIAFFLSVIVITTIMYLSYTQVSHWRNSISLFTYELSINPDSEDAALNCGWAWKNRQNYREARKYYERAISINPDGYLGYAYYGFMLDQLGQVEDAVFMYRKALSHEFSNIGAYVNIVYNNLAERLFQIGQHNKGLEVLKKGLQLFPDDTQLLITQELRNNGETLTAPDS